MKPNIIVWTAGSGDKFAAESVGTPESPRVIYAVYRQSAPFYANGEITNAHPITLDELKACVEVNHYAGSINRDGLTWIEGRELEQAAREQNPIPERSLSEYISYPDRCQLTDEQRAELFDLLTKGTRQHTREAIARALKHPERLPSKGIFSRLMVTPRVEYVAGQDYPAELRTIRDLLKNY